MSGMIMLRRNDGIELLSDGGLFRSVSDFSITGITSKPIVLPHISAVIGIGGTSELAFFLRANQMANWTSFDHLMETIEDGVRLEIDRLFYYQAGRTRVDAILQIGGYSTERNRWESRMLIVNAPIFEEPKITRFDDLWFLFAPAPTPEGLERYGFDPEKPDVGPSIEDAVRFMRAMRASQHPMGDIGDDADSAPTGATIAGFIERVVVLHDQVITQVLWRWPDIVGEMVDPANEGEPTALYRALYQPAPKEEDEAA